MTSGWPMKRLHLAILLALGACQPLESGTTIPPREIAGGVSFPARKLTCSDPVRRGDTKESLRMRYAVMPNSRRSLAPKDPSSPAWSCGLPIRCAGSRCSSPKTEPRR